MSDCHQNLVTCFRLLSARPNARRLVEIDPRQVKIRPPLIRFPGCFTVEIKNLRVLKNDDVLGNSFFAKSEYQWLNVKQFGSMKCQNATSNGERDLQLPTRLYSAFQVVAVLETIGKLKSAF